MKVVIKRAYDKPTSTDGHRVLVDRLWPRGVKKEALELDEWLKDVGPSTELRQWFGHDPGRFDEFAEHYRDELSSSKAFAELQQLAADHDKLTLVYAAKDPKCNHAIVLRDHLVDAAQ